MRARVASSYIAAREGVSAVPGAMALTRIFCAIHSIASIRVIWINPPLAVP